MQNFRLAGTIAAENTLNINQSINGTVQNIHLGGDGSMKINTPSIEDIRAMICE